MRDEEGFQAERPRKRDRSAQNDDEQYGLAPAGRSAPRKTRRRQRHYEDEEINDGGISTLIPYTNPKALIAYYLGIFGLIPCLGSLLGPAALILGILGLRVVQKHPTAKGTGHAIAGIVLGSLETLGNWAAIAFTALGAAGAFK
jgi:Domain of unknown function (DUF4190)